MMAASWLEPVDATFSASPTPSASSTASTVSPSPPPEPAGGASDGGAATPWLGWATLGAALIAAVVALYAATLQRKSSRRPSSSGQVRDSRREQLPGVASLSEGDRRDGNGEHGDGTCNGRTAQGRGLRRALSGCCLALGNANAAVRLAGVYSMGRLADDWDEQRQTCVDVLCAYMRMSFQEGVSQVGSQEDEVRASIVKNIAQRMVPGQDSPGSTCGST